MSIMIDKAKCKGCGMCTSVCPGSLIYQDSEKKPLSNILRTAGAVPHASRNVILALLRFILEQT